MIEWTLPVFTPQQHVQAHALLATRVAYMMGRKLEEADWSDVYCAAKGIPKQGWSNLSIDVIHENLGVEHKMIRTKSGRSILTHCGTSLMHPALTRSIRIPSTKEDPNVVMGDVFAQYAQLVESRTAKVRETSGEAEPDMRLGWLLWQESLREFLYFEYRMTVPNANDYFAEWRETTGSSRKGSKNLWIFHKETKQKRYSVTTEAGIKIQPYFDVPPPNDPNLYLFTVQGELTENDLVRLWLTVSTARELERLVGSLEQDRLSTIIIEVAGKMEVVEELGITTEAEAKPIVITKQAYATLVDAFEGVSDEHRVQLLTAYLREHEE
jgi:hypothetical protein